ncbi:MAG: hypothetical protein M1821_006825 [Bathelium mastoideum]|nr:MAG: hypothetical protein M1821_006825 [Bathelium mastoideum]
MLSRGSSDAGNRLRRAKSGSSTTGKPPPPQTQAIDPAVSRQYAEAAAATAYERALGAKHSSRSDLVRNRSKSGRSSQGSHLQSCLAAIRSPQDSGKALGRCANDRPPTALTTPAKSGTVNRAESFIKLESQLETQNTAEENHDTEPSSFRRLRKSRSLHSASEPQPIAQDTEHSERTAIKSDQGNKSAFRRSKISLRASQLIEPEVQSSDKAIGDIAEREMVARARDRIFQQLHSRRLRESTSFMVLSRSLKKRQEDQRHPLEQESGVRYDNKIPSPEKGRKSPQAAPRMRDRARVLSAPFAHSFKRLLRKSSTSSDMPDQQREASKLYFEPPNDHHPGASTQESGAENNDLHTIAETHQASTMHATHRVPTPRPRIQSQYSSGSEAASSMTRSRVTSWSDSTAPDTVGTAISLRLPVIDEQGNVPDPASFYEPKAPNSVRSGQKRQGSRTLERREKRHSSTSQRIYSALMKKVEPSASFNKEDPPVIPDHSPDPKSALDSLPSRKHGSRLSRLSRLSKGTIRTVTPDTYAGTAKRLPSDMSRTKLMAPSPKPYSERPLNNVQAETISAKALDDDPASTTRTGLNIRTGHNAWTTNAASPTRVVLEKRAERAKNRWRSSLDPAGSPFFSSRISKWSTEESPSGMRSSRRAFGTQLPLAGMSQGTLSIHNSQDDHAGLGRDLVSPSVYSKDTNGHSREQLSPASRQSGAETSIIITSRDIQSFPITSPQTNSVHRTLTSQSTQDWKTWLASEITDPDFPDQEISISAYNQDIHTSTQDLQPEETLSQSNSGHRRERAEIDSRERMSGGPVPPAEKFRSRRSRARQLRKQGALRDCSGSDGDRGPAGISDKRNARPTLPRQGSSLMNERFPMLWAGKSPSSTDFRDTRKPSPKSQTSASPSSAQPSRIPKPASSNTTECKSSPLTKSTADVIASQESTSLPQSPSSVFILSPSKHHDDSTLKKVTASNNINNSRNLPRNQPKSKSIFDLSASSPILDPKRIPPFTESQPHSPSHPAFATPGKENTPVASPHSTPKLAARISATPANAAAIRSRRVRPSPSRASLRGDEPEAQGRVTPSMLDVWLEGRQREAGEKGVEKEGEGRGGSFAFL